MGDIIENQLAQQKVWNSGYANLSQPIVAKRSAFMAFMDESDRRALSGINNRVVTHPQLVLGTGGGSGGVVGIALTTVGSVIIDGMLCAGTANTNIQFPASLGTQGTGTYCKYLVSMDKNGKVTITKGNESAAGTAGTYYGYGTPALAPGAFMPDLPQQNCAIGYVEIFTGATAFTSGVGAINSGVSSMNIVQLYNMPIYEP
jgi:hypothetical protein